MEKIALPLERKCASQTSVSTANRFLIFYFGSLL